MKKCNKCGAEKHFDEFSKDKHKKDGRRTICRICSSKLQKERYKPKPRDTSFDLTEIIIEGVSHQAKKCRGCHVLKPLTEYYQHDSCLGGVNSKCKSCEGIKGLYTHATIEKITLNGQNLEGKKCVKCSILKPLNDFTEIKSKSRKGIGGRYAQCKECEYNYRKELDRNPERKKRRLVRSRLYTKGYKGRKRELYHLNKDLIAVRCKVKDANRWARKKLLRDELTEAQYKEILHDFNDSCALTQNKENITLEHFIPLITGHGGSYVSNVYPAIDSLNYSKSGANPFEWYEREDIKKMVSKANWDYLISYLSAPNNMSIDEFKDFVNWCFENTRTIDDLKHDNTESTKLFKKRTKGEVATGEAAVSQFNF